MNRHPLDLSFTFLLSLAASSVIFLLALLAGAFAAQHSTELGMPSQMAFFLAGLCPIALACFVGSVAYVAKERESSSVQSSLLNETQPHRTGLTIVKAESRH